MHMPPEPSIPPFLPPAPEISLNGSSTILKGPLAINETQYTKLAEIERNYARGTSVKLVQMRNDEDQLEELLLAQPIDADKLKSLQEKINAEKDELANLTLEYRLAQQQALTEEQRSALRRNADRKVVDHFGISLPTPMGRFDWGLPYR